MSFTRKIESIKKSEGSYKLDGVRAEIEYETDAVPFNNLDLQDYIVTQYNQGRPFTKEEIKKCPLDMEENFFRNFEKKHPKPYTFNEFRFFENIKVQRRYDYKREGRSKYMTELSFPDYVPAIMSYFCFKCTALEKVVLPKNLKCIFVGAFMNCDRLREVEIPEHVNRIWDEAFLGCRSLGKITIPKSVVILRDSAFKDCTGLKEVVFEKGSLTSRINSSLFCNCISLEKVVLPARLTMIKSYAFQNCKNLRSIAIPELVEGVESFAFDGCSRLQEIEFKGEKVKSLHFGVFSGCLTLKRIKVHSAINLKLGIPESARLHSITITCPEGLKEWYENPLNFRQDLIKEIKCF